ncbi:CxxxxCH/CxxCH domain-containing protein [Geobacter argillaceus]|uniref:Putative CxxxxCH...CXXCH cytochrome family protein n=1 Tax=Geobacter argillaceus TaxID=345631 RepID=A0A562V7K7_9BACT|nr:CxxxxCH/CxxCH domain-containing protein [Geobacter argillaceus]TWJ13889.1 putative CxxxxCH...CXXCH cytochrome family protein [Geobacter argillaceus]
MKRFVKLFSVAAVTAVLWGCSTANDSATINEAGKHPAGWADVNTGGNHPGVYLASPGQCFVCHGNDLKGGISAVSCFSASFNGITCHPRGPSAHPTGFADPANHGARAKAALGGMNGFAFCQKCHGTAFNGGTTPAGITSSSCVACHGVAAPHSKKPWRGSTRTHASVDQSNAAVCAQCHTAGANLSTPVITTYASGTPGCFNSTLCHGAVGHASDPRQPWSSADNHGKAAKGSPDAGDGMALCRACHGQPLSGNGSVPSCFSCHQTAPHSPSPWRRTITTPAARTHADTNTQNAPVCAGCHQGNQRLTVPVAVTGTPSCFDNSMCHGATGHNDTTLFPVPAQAWNVPVNHGAKAKGSTMAGNSGFTYCRNCHGTGSTADPLFKGGRALTSCMNVLGCHGMLNNAPHPSAPWRGTTAAGSIGHPSTDTSNDAICAICHTNGANSSRTPQPQDLKGNTGCFNATMCHGITGHADTTVYPAPWSAPVNHGAFARTDPSAGATKGFSYCQHCHSTDFSGGNAQQSCYPCHTVSAPHPKKADWTLAAGTLSHVNTGEGNAAICANCHNNTTKNLSSAPVNYQARFAPAGSFNQLALPGCYNGSLCHANVRKTSNCDACHGPLSPTVFNSLAGVTSTSDAKVGTHISHLNAATQTVPLSANIACGECHPVPSSPVIGGAHRNGTTDITFGTLAKTGGLTPTYSGGSCSNTYCHGATLPASSPARANPSWNAPFLTGTAGTVGDGSTTSGTGDCSKCHGYPPMTAAHTGKLATQCISCHPHVNASGTGFTDPTKHINGTIDASGGHGFPYDGATHRSVANAQAPFTNCTGCHDATTSGGTYPVAAGTAPLCSACHLSMGNFTGATPGCWDCHGATASDGRPNGTSFPNRQGGLNGHNRSTHIVACTVCHPFTAGDTRHGWSNRQTSSYAQVNATINWNPGTRQPGTGSCTPSCHGLQTGWY